MIEVLPIHHVEYIIVWGKGLFVVSSLNRLLVPRNTHTSLVHVLGLLQIVYIKSH
jgi:hypothetical protein